MLPTRHDKAQVTEQPSWLKRCIYALEKMPDSFDIDRFKKLVRYAFLLEVIHLHKLWPEVFNGISDLHSWSLFHEDTLARERLFEHAVNEFESLRNLPSIPVSSSIR